LRKPCLKLVINCGPCEEYIAACLVSVRAQTYANWRACVTIDPCGDRTIEAARNASDGDVRIEITQNRRRLYAMQNLINGIRRSRAEADDVIVVLDGDDWLASEHALGIIASTYERYDCWATYGSWLSNDPSHSGMPRGLWPAYDPDTTDFRHTEWLGTAVRTWKAWLWNLIDNRDLRDASGDYFRVTEDQASMLPILEMCGTARARHIEDVLMIYNRTTPHACGKLRYQEMLANCAYLRGRRPYSLLHDRRSRPEINSADSRVAASR